MSGRRGFGLFGLLVTILVAGVVGILAYNAGVSAGAAAAGGATGAVAPYIYPGFGFGFGFFGILFFILLVWLLFAAVGRGRGWGGPPRGWYGGPWREGPGSREVPPFVEPMLQDWHERAHGKGLGATGDRPGDQPGRSDQPGASDQPGTRG